MRKITDIHGPPLARSKARRLQHPTKRPGCGHLRPPLGGLPAAHGGRFLGSSAATGHEARRRRIDRWHRPFGGTDLPGRGVSLPARSSNRDEACNCVYVAHNVQGVHWEIRYGIVLAIAIDQGLVALTKVEAHPAEHGIIPTLSQQGVHNKDAIRPPPTAKPYSLPNVSPLLPKV
jgi:hypothetical protein